MCISILNCVLAVDWMQSQKELTVKLILAGLVMRGWLSMRTNNSFVIRRLDSLFSVPS